MGIRDLCHLHDIALLSTRPDLRPPRDAGSESLQVQQTQGPELIRETLARLGHRTAEPTIKNRLSNDLRFAVFLEDTTPVASAWLASGGRYIDELNWWLPIDAHELWLRDVYVAPACRGRRLFSAMVASLAQQLGTRRIWSDVDWDNVASMRAHRSAGFGVVARLRAIDLGGRFRFRSALPPWPLPVAELDPTSRVIWLRGDRLRRHRELLA